MTLVETGVSAILFVQIASLVGAVAGVALADRWMRNSSRGRIFTSAIGMILFLPADDAFLASTILPYAIVVQGRRLAKLLLRDRNSR